MPSFSHKKLVERIARVDQVPDDQKEYADWIKASGHLALLRENANEDELIVLALGKYTFIHAAVVLNDKLSPPNKDDLLGWSCNPYSSMVVSLGVL